jgi:selenide,water dikinase
MVKKTGCSSKIGQADLLRILGNLPPVVDPNILVGTAAGDDAGVYRLGEGRALVQTVDVFTPCVDDPYLFGQIAAANSLSDIYAMGGKPLTALSVIGFPIDEVDGAVMEEILRGGIDTLNEAGCSLIGGHSINDEEIKCGFAVTGLIDEQRIKTRESVAEGDALVLTKPLGTGIVCFGAQLGRISAACLEEVGVSMATLNRDAAELMEKHEAHACTDITGFGLLGHLVEMVRESGFTAEIDLARIPVFSAVEECLRREILPGAIERNQEYSLAWVVAESAESEGYLPVLFDPQTSGGLLVALPEAAAAEYVAGLRSRGHAAASIIGRIIRPPRDGLGGKVLVTNTTLGNFFGTREGAVMEKEMSSSENERNAAMPPPAANPATGNACCDSPPSLEENPPESDALDTFRDFMRLTGGKGEIDRRSKKLIAIALSVAQRCRPCLVAHIRGAQAMGITRAEIEEAAALAISFAGCPSLMLYKEVCEEIWK